MRVNNGVDGCEESPGEGRPMTHDDITNNDMANGDMTNSDDRHQSDLQPNDPLESLLQLHHDMNGSLGDGAAGLDDEFAVDPRNEDCLTMPRLRTLAAQRDQADGREAPHLAACGVCAARLAAFQTRVQPAAPIAQISAGRIVGWSAAAAAALIVVALLATLLVSSDENGSFRSPLAQWEASREIPAPNTLMEEKALINKRNTLKAG